MKLRRSRFTFSAVGALLGVAAFAVFETSAALAQARATVADARDSEYDLADEAEGPYFGSVISDAGGSSRSNVSISVTKIGPNRVLVSSDYERLPSFEVSLTRYMHTIQNAEGEEVFVLDLSKSPPSLDITVAGASWSGVRR